MTYQNILLIDDDADDQEIFKSALETVSDKLICTEFTNAKEALGKLINRELTPDLIFLDLNMPVMSGVEFLAQVKKQETTKQIPVIMFSTSSQTATIELTKQLGAIDFITKPNKFDALIDILKSIFK